MLDISAGGLCFVAPVCLKVNARVQVEIVVPRGKPVLVVGEVRHRRPYRAASSGRRGWATGLALTTPGPDFLALTSPAALTEASDRTVLESQLGGAPNPMPSEVADDDEPLDSLILVVEEEAVYRVRLKAVGSSRTRTLTLRGVSESAVCEAVLRDLPGDWEVLGIDVDPID